jgi:hypothetical protein
MILFFPFMFFLSGGGGLLPIKCLIEFIHLPFNNVYDGVNVATMFDSRQAIANPFKMHTPVSVQSTFAIDVVGVAGRATD